MQVTQLVVIIIVIICFVPIEKLVLVVYLQPEAAAIFSNGGTSPEARHP